MSEDEWIIACRILAWVQERRKRQIHQLQELLGVREHFGEKVKDLWSKAEKP